ncbi:MAG: hypothetical protein OES29_08085 [Desulfuromonadales bacterium]|nr:hypothetical protein [Desulfuromonadales bacterium]
MKSNELLLLREELQRRARDMGARSFGIADLTPARDAIVAQGGEILAGFERALSVGIGLGDGIVDQLPRHKEVTVARTYDQLYITVNQKKFSFVTTVGDMPDVITWKVMPVCARHL